MADETVEQVKLQKLLEEAMKKNSDQLARQKEDLEKINQLYRDRLDKENQSVDFSEVIAQNNKIARVEARIAARELEENLERQRNFEVERLKIEKDLNTAREKEKERLEQIKKLELSIAQAKNNTY